MTVVADYANLFEAHVRPRKRGLKRAAALAVWTGLFLVRPGLALQIWDERRAF